jgi:predicted transposase YbfD/YdcC
MPAPKWVVQNWPGSATVIDVWSRCKRDGKSIDETRYYVKGLRACADDPLRQVCDRWLIENSWLWPRDTLIKVDAHRCREPNGVQMIATLRSLAMNALPLDDFQ